MKILGGGKNNFFGLDIGTTSIRVVQLKGKGPIKNLCKYGHSPTEGNMTLSDSEADRQRVIKVTKDLVASVGIDTKNVAVNIPSDQVFSTVIEMDRMSPDDLGKTILYQAESFIPTSPAQSKIDWAIIGDSPSDPKKIEVLLSSVPNKYVDARLAMIENAGFKVIAFEPDSMSLVRAVIPAEATLPQMVLDIGRTSTDLIISMAGNPHLTRSIPTGTATFIKATAQVLNIDENQASQFIYKFGLGKDKLEGQVYKAIIPSVEILMVEP